MGSEGTRELGGRHGGRRRRGGGNTVHGDKAPVDGKGEATTPAKRADISGGQECGVVHVEDVQRVETPVAEITNAMKDTEIVKNKDRREEAARGKKRRPSPWPTRGAGRKHCWFSSIQHGNRGTSLPAGAAGRRARPGPRLEQDLLAVADGEICGGNGGNGQISRLNPFQAEKQPISQITILHRHPSSTEKKQRQPTDASDSPTDEHPTNHALSLERKPVSP
uniref:Uncharacterized protein n=1 Tax=Oryza sativa subsp. japonica TaxID=39947 RepID=Q7F8U1_ORYSJ|nr:hypothetical protein [Oryza sativa Japonica Group]